MLLLGHATRSPRWDIPKGLAEPDENFVQAAARELYEETGLVAELSNLVDLGVHDYLRTKNLALFLWRPDELPDPGALVCASTFVIGERHLPEFDRFGLFPWEEAGKRVGRNLARVLGGLRNRLEEAG